MPGARVRGYTSPTHLNFIFGVVRLSGLFAFVPLQISSALCYGTFTVDVCARRNFSDVCWRV